jgi:hypothetical protein
MSRYDVDYLSHIFLETNYIILVLTMKLSGMLLSMKFL